MRNEDSYKRIFSTWYEILKPVVYTEKFEKFLVYLESRYKLKRPKILPDVKSVFKTFSATPFDDVHTLILFDRRSLKNDYNGLGFGQKESAVTYSPDVWLFYDAIYTSLNLPFNLGFDETLESLAKQGILFLNTIGTYEPLNVTRHRQFWHKFNCEILKQLSAHKTHINYLLIGSDSWKYEKYITGKNSYVFKIESFNVAETERRFWNFDFTVLDKLIKLNHNKTMIWYEKL